MEGIKIMRLVPPGHKSRAILSDAPLEINLPPVNTMQPTVEKWYSENKIKKQNKTKNWKHEKKKKE